MHASARSAFLAGTAALTLAARRPARAQAPMLRIGTGPADAYAEAWFAQDQGFFQKAGLTVDVQSFNSGSAASSAVVGGTLDIAITTPIPIANAVLRSVPLVIVAAAATNTAKSPQAVICVRKSGPIRSARNLAGKTVGVNVLKTLLELGLDVWLAKNNVDIPSVKVVEVLFSEMGPALDRGTIDAAVIGEPALSAALKSNDVRILTDPMVLIAPRFLSAAWFSTTQFAQRNPELVARFANVIYETARWANRHHAESAPILAKYTKMNVEDASTMLRAEFAESLRVSEIQPLLDACAKYGLLPRPVRAADLVLH